MMLFFTVFSCYSYCCLAAIVFTPWVAVPFFASLHHFFLCNFHCCHPFCHSQARQQLSQLFIQGWTFLLLHCRFCSGPVITIHFAAKDSFIVTTGHCLVVFFWLSFISHFSCHCSTNSNWFFPSCILLSSIVLYLCKRCEHAYQSFIAAYGMRNVRRLCGYSALACAVKV